MAFRPLSVVSDFREALFQSFMDAQDAGLEMDQIEKIVREEFHEYAENEILREPPDEPRQPSVDIEISR